MKRAALTLLLIISCGPPTDKSGEDGVVIINNNVAPNNLAPNNIVENNTTANVAPNSSTANSTTGPPTVSAADYLDRSREIFCNAIWDCPGASTLPYHRMHARHGSVEACESALAGPVTRRALAESVEAGFVEYDPELAAECLAAIEQRLCDGTWFKTPPVQACLDVIRGTVGPGEECAHFYECAEGYCDTQQACGVRTCTAYSVQCGDDVCSADEYCDREPDPDQCRPRVALGGSCSAVQCETGTSCDDAQDGTCVAVFSGGAGSPCSSDNTCGVDLVCDDGVCTAPRFSGSDGPCSPLGAAACEPGLTCISPADTPLEGSCRTPLGLGASCRWDADCGPDTFCDVWNDNVCAAYFEDGATCQSFAQCQSQNCPGGMGTGSNGVCEAPCSR